MFIRSAAARKTCNGGRKGNQIAVISSPHETTNCTVSQGMGHQSASAQPVIPAYIVVYLHLVSSPGNTNYVIHKYTAKRLSRPWITTSPTSTRLAGQYAG